MSVVIRPRTEEDIPALADVLVRVHTQNGYPVEGVSDPEGWLRSDRMLGAWVAVQDGRPVGQVMLTEPTEHDAAAAMLAERHRLLPAEIAVLCRLFIDPDARGHGLARRLISAAVDGVKAANRCLVLDVMKKDLSAIHIYRCTGWVELGTFLYEFSGGEVPAIAFHLPADR